ncbi:MAG TPA: hypothetical protein QGF35_02880 [Dehalococcoidia bacterium]|nr:hypothetical protein [Dehalococcoidia bacterium]
MIRARGRTESFGEGSAIRQVWEGFQFIIRHPILPGLFLLDIGITVVSFYREILPVLVRGLFQGGAGERDAGSLRIHRLGADPLRLRKREHTLARYHHDRSTRRG